MLFAILQSFKLLLPALIPSWRFFSDIAPSPRVEFCLQDKTQTLLWEWQEFRPRPQRLPLWRMVLRMFWNPDWNESLFLVSCSERMIEAPTHHSVKEIQNRIRRDLLKHPTLPTGAQLRFRLVFVRREGKQIVKEVEYQSAPFELQGGSHVL